MLLSGYPGSGKSTLAARLASRLAFPLVSKDAMLIAIFEAQGLPAERIEEAGKAAWAVFWHMARSMPFAVLDTNVKPRSPIERAELNRLADAQIVEVRCVCPIDLAIHRYIERGKSAHYAQRFREPSREHFAQYEGPVDVGDLIEVETTSVPDAEVVAVQIEKLFDKKSPELMRGRPAL